VAATSRKHHYLPVSYLAGFTESGDVDDFLFVFDLEKREVRPGKPRTVAYETDLNRLDMPGVAPDLFEHGVWAKAESLVAPVIARVARERDFSAGDLNGLLNFAAMAAARVPRLQSAFPLLVEQVTGLSLPEGVRDPKQWELILKWSAEAEIGWSDKEVRGFLADPRCQSAHPQVWRFFSTVMLHDVLLRLLAERAWSLYVAPDDQYHFISSDNPVGILHSPPEVPARTPQFQERNTVVTLPVSRHVALVGRYEGEYSVVHVNPRAVARVNFMTLERAWRFLYARSKEFVCLRAEDGGVGNSADVLAHLRQNDGSVG